MGIEAFLLDRAEKEGKNEEKLSAARKLKELGVAIDIIAKATGLTEEEIRKL